MRTLRSRNLLWCFYCGRKSNIYFDGQRSFDCANCEATNWLDKNGEITDPPAEPESAKRNTVRYATPLSSTIRSPSPTPLTTDDQDVDSIFCATCLRNQHMLSSSLAQFEWPDDPSTAEYAARERRYWSLRKDLENRYPQVCAVCKPKVDQKLHQASYTAKTDHLRRMMDRTRLQRKEVRQRGFLDLVDYLGELSWYAGFAFQTAWHLVVVAFLLAEQFTPAITPAITPASNNSYVFMVLDTLHRIAASTLPYTDRLMQWAINLCLCSFPWNPRFKQSVRGFTAHILGFRQWYTYQLLILMMRLVCLSITQYSKSQVLPVASQLGVQVVIPLIMVHIYRVARQTIRTDTTPLFRQSAPLRSSSNLQADSKSAVKDPHDLGSVLDDILHAPVDKQTHNGHVSPPSQRGRNPTTSTNPRGHQRRDRDSWNRGASNTTMGGLSLSDSFSTQGQNSVATQYEEEMDWSPSASQHRAFSSYNPYKIKNTNPRFSDTPTEDKSGPIWYKVPPAPTNPAQRQRNPTRPIIRESPKEIKENFFQGTRTGRHVGFGSSSQDKTSGFDLAKPKFYAPEPKDDPRDGLSSMFANSFSLSPDPEGEEARVQHARRQVDGHKEPEVEALPNRTTTRVVELVFLFAALCGWIFALSSGEHFARSGALASVCAGLIVSVRLAADLEVDRHTKEQGPLSIYRPSFAGLALLQVVAVLFLMWSIWSGTTLRASGTYGNVLFGGIITHQMWHIFA
ncbi:hypothetical protein F5Y16DRAFT_362439 [Xylariaceae sp. FL0255]|nr:hypothetical protein F5Y16DRAFT_362439 [Xylariaceae sp. FL0255]